VGGQHAFDFLNVPHHARLAGLGGVNVSLSDRDINFFSSNPALVSDSLAGFASASYQFYIADISHAAVAYAHRFNRIGTVTIGLQHLAYGKIISYDAAGQELGDFNSGETAVVISKSHQVSHYRFGVNLKTVFSNLAGFRASAVLIDLGGVFVHPQKDFRVGLVMKNLGVVLSEYSETSRSTLPFDVQAGITFKPEHMPLRFSITAYNLVQDSGYPDPVTGEEPGTLDKVLRRFNFGTEILVHRNVNILAGYNYLARQELKLENAGGGAGITLGFSARIKTVDVCFSRSSFVIGNAGYTFTVSSNVDRMVKRN
jgi:hypothetical protein